MKKVLVLLPPGFEDIEAVTIVDILRRGGARVTLAGTSQGPVEGSRGIKIVPDCLFDTVSSTDFDLVVLPGGQPGTSNLQKNDKVLAFLKTMHSAGKLVGAICAAPLVLQDAGLLKGKNATCHPSVRENLHSAHYREERVVVDGNIITSQAPGTAMEFSLKLLEVLFNKERAITVNTGVMSL